MPSHRLVRVVGHGPEIEVEVAAAPVRELRPRQSVILTTRHHTEKRGGSATVLVNTPRSDVVVHGTVYLQCIVLASPFPASADCPMEICRSRCFKVQTSGECSRWLA